MRAVLLRLYGMSRLAHAIIRFSSAQRLNPDTTTSDDCRILLPRIFHAVCAQVVSAQVPNTIYTVPAGWNGVTIHGVGTATVAPGFYSPTALAAAVQAQLLLLDASFTCTYSALTAAFTIARGTNFTLDEATGSDYLKTLVGRMGFANTTYAGAATYTGAATTGAYPASVYVHCDEFNDMQGSFAPVQPADATVLASIPLTGTAGTGYSAYEATLHDEVAREAYQGRCVGPAVRFWFTDPDENPISFNGADWLIELSVWFDPEKARR